MSHDFEPFTPEAFRQQTGLSAVENEAIYIRWVNTQINYANYQQMLLMNHRLQAIATILSDRELSSETK